MIWHDLTVSDSALTALCTCMQIVCEQKNMHIACKHEEQVDLVQLLRLHRYPAAGCNVDIRTGADQIILPSPCTLAHLSWLAVLLVWPTTVAPGCCSSHSLPRKLPRTPGPTISRSLLDGALAEEAGWAPAAAAMSAAAHGGSMPRAQ